MPMPMALWWRISLCTRLHSDRKHALRRRAILKTGCAVLQPFSEKHAMAQKHTAPGGADHSPRSSQSALTLAALGVVFGDIGTSPL
jgi:hypothetical protein